MNELMGAIFRVLLQLVVLLAGLVILASFLVVALLVLAFWLVRALWARLTGQPVQPWTFQFNRQAMWSRFYRPPGREPEAARDESNVIDVEIKEIKETKSRSE